MFSRSNLLLILSALWAAGDAQALSFSKVTDAGNPIASEGGHSQQRYFGCAWADYDLDGDWDLFVDLNRLYRNDGGGAFTRVLDSGLGDDQIASGAFSMAGVTWGDYDNDGDPDAFLSGERSHLYQNQGNGSFTTVTTGDIGGGAANRGWACAWGDYDNDGNLDLAITHPANFVPGGPALENMLFHNEGPPSYGFTRITTGPIVEGLDSYTVGTWSDHDGDGDLDYFIGSGPANGTLQPDNLYRNLLTETSSADFERITEAPIATDDQDGQVWNWIDYDNDGDLDGYLTNWGGSQGGLANRLYRQESDGSFTRVSGDPIVNDVGISLASIWEDFDNDGDLDCYVGNDGAQVDALYENDGDGTFTKVTTTPITNQAQARRSAGAADYDDDGDMDLFVNGPLTSRALYRNENANGHAWLAITLSGGPSNRSGIGAKVRLKATISGNPVWQIREISGQNSFNGHSAQVAHFGLRDATLADSVTVEWPSGAVSVLTDVAPGQRITIAEGDPASTPPLAPGGRSQLRLELAGPSPFSAGTSVRCQLAQAERILVQVLDVQGRVVRDLAAGEYAPGAHRIDWDGRDANGRPAAAGVYTIRLRATSGTGAQSVVVVR